MPYWIVSGIWTSYPDKEWIHVVAKGKHIAKVLRLDCKQVWPDTFYCALCCALHSQLRMVQTRSVTTCFKLCKITETVGGCNLLIEKSWENKWAREIRQCKLLFFYHNSYTSPGCVVRRRTMIKDPVWPGCNCAHAEGEHVARVLLCSGKKKEHLRMIPSFANVWANQKSE